MEVAAGAPYRSGPAAFVLQQPALAFEAPVVAGQAAAGPGHPMARHDGGDRVRGAAHPDRPRHPLAAELDGEVAVGRRLAGRDLAQRGPDLLLERAALHGYRDVIEGAHVTCEVSRQRLADRAEIVHPLDRRAPIPLADEAG